MKEVTPKPSQPKNNINILLENNKIIIDKAKSFNKMIK